MTIRYDQPNATTRVVNEAIRRLAEAGIGIAGSRALRVRGRKSGKVTRRGDERARRRRPRVRRVAARERPMGTQRPSRRGRRNRAAVAPPASADRGSSRRRQARTDEEVSRSVVLGGQGSRRRVDPRVDRRRNAGCRTVYPGLRAAPLGRGWWGADATRSGGDDVFASLLAGDLPRHRRRILTPGAVEHPDDRRPAVGG